MEKGKTGDRQEALRVYTVVLEGMQFVGHHGCLEKEKELGNLFLVDFKGEYESVAGSTDNLDDTLDYGKIYRIVAEQMAVRRNLLEALAHRIVVAVAGRFPQLIRFEVRVSKKNPPFSGFCEWSRISEKWERE